MATSAAWTGSPTAAGQWAPGEATPLQNMLELAVLRNRKSSSPLVLKMTTACKFTACHVVDLQQVSRMCNVCGYVMLLRLQIRTLVTTFTTTTDIPSLCTHTPLHMPSCPAIMNSVPGTGCVSLDGDTEV